MSIAITDDHRALAETASEVLRKRDARGAARALLEAPTEERPELWADLVSLGWLGLHLPEEYGGAGDGGEERVVGGGEGGRRGSGGRRGNQLAMRDGDGGGVECGYEVIE